jgi:hypothetical protein
MLKPIAVHRVPQAGATTVRGQLRVHHGPTVKGVGGGTRTGEGGHDLTALQAIEDGGLASTVQAEDEDSYILVPSEELRKEAREEITWVQSSRNHQRSSTSERKIGLPRTHALAYSTVLGLLLLM